MLEEKVRSQRTDDVHAKMVLLRVFEGSLGEFRSNAATPHSWWYFRMPDRDPSLAVRIEFEICDFPAVFDFEPASSDSIGLLAHGSALLTKDVRL